MLREPEGAPAFLAECELARGGNALLDAHLDRLRSASAARPRVRGRRVVEGLALARRACWCATPAPRGGCVLRRPAGRRRPGLRHAAAGTEADPIIERAPRRVSGVVAVSAPDRGGAGGGKSVYAVLRDLCPTGRDHPRDPSPFACRDLSTRRAAARRAERRCREAPCTACFFGVGLRRPRARRRRAHSSRRSSPAWPAPASSPCVRISSGRGAEPRGVTDYAATDLIVRRPGARRHPAAGSDQHPALARRCRGQDGSPPRRVADYTAYLRKLVARYGPGGSFWRRTPISAPSARRASGRSGTAQPAVPVAPA